MSAETVPTVEEVQQRLLQRRRELGIREDGAASEPEKEIGFEAHTSRCRECGETFEWRAVLVNGKPVPAERDRCNDCVALAEQQVDAEESELEAARRRVLLEQREAQRLDLLHQITGNASEHREMRFDNFDTSECGELPRQVCLDFLTEVKRAQLHDQIRGVYLHGETGPGKTHLVVSIVQALLADPDFDPRRIVFDRADELILRIQDTYNTPTSTFAVLERRWEADIWILDDLGTERPSDDAARHLNLIFSRRPLRPTLVTSNHDPLELEAKYSELKRLVSRFGPRYFRVVPVLGRDRRFG